MSEQVLDEVAVNELEKTIRSFASVLGELRVAHAALAERAERVEADLCRANAELAAKVAELEAVLSSLPTGVVVRDASGRVTRANGPALSILGAEEADLLGSECWPGLAGTDASGEPRTLLREDGQELQVSGRFAAIQLEDGHEVGSVEILDDRTDFEAMREHVHRMDKVAALGTMAGGIAHEIRNPLNAARGYGSLLQQRADEDSVEGRWSRTIVAAVDECNAIVSSLLTLASPEGLNLETIEAGDWIEETLELCRRDAGEGIEHEIRTEITPCTFAGDRIKLRQALRNLVANAMGAQPEGGLVVVSLDTDDQGVHVRVTDAGPGIPAQLHARVGDPFFTTRAEGTGLGLALVNAITRLHGGSLEIRPEPAPEGGADIRIHLPPSPTRTER